MKKGAIAYWILSWISWSLYTFGWFGFVVWAFTDSTLNPVVALGISTGWLAACVWQFPIKLRRWRCTVRLYVLGEPGSRVHKMDHYGTEKGAERATCSYCIELRNAYSYQSLNVVSHNTTVTEG